MTVTVVCLGLSFLAEEHVGHERASFGVVDCTSVTVEKLPDAETLDRKVVIVTEVVDYKVENSSTSTILAVPLPSFRTVPGVVTARVVPGNNAGMPTGSTAGAPLVGF